MSEVDRYAVIGHPIAHSRSPVIHRLFAEQTGQLISYGAMDVRPEELDTAVTRFFGEGGKGLNVTVPHKGEVARLVDALDERAAQAGAVNTIYVRTDGTLGGDNTDGHGLVTDLQQNLGIEIQDRRILIFGAGGATRGIVPVLVDSGPAELVIANRTLEKARLLELQFASSGNVAAVRFEDLTEPFDLVLNATSAGLKGEEAPFPSDVVDSHSVCYDLAYAMQPTPFQVWARRHGAAAAHSGWGMLIEQAAESFRVWRGVRPDTGPIRAALAPDV